MALVNPMLLTALTPSMSGTWLRMMSTPMPVRKPSITKWETNRRYRPDVGERRHDHDQAGERGKKDQAVGPLFHCDACQGGGRPPAPPRSSS